MAVQAITDPVWSRIDRREPDECWPWIGYLTKPGYGRLGGKIASRIVYECVVGPIPDRMFVMHRCDNPSCCNPAHLSIGTPRDNSADMVAKQRSNRGEKRPTAKLTSDQIKTIRADGRMLKEIAADYGVSAQLVSGIRKRQRWQHL